MPDATSSTQLILLTAIIGILLVLALILTRISANLVRISRQFHDFSKKTDTSSVSKSGEMREQEISAYEIFLNEDSKRRKLPKKDRFELYRLWRKEKGLNWTPPNSDSDTRD